MAVAVQTLRIELGGATHDFPVLSMLDRRKRSCVRKQWCLVRATELLLFNVQDRSRGRFAAHLAKMSMEGGLLVADRAAVEEGVLKEEELEAGEPRPPARLPPHRALHRRGPLPLWQSSDVCVPSSTSRHAPAAAKPPSCRSPSSARR